MTGVRAKFIPKFLTVERKNLCFEIPQNNLESVAKDDNVLKKVISGYLRL